MLFPRTPICFQVWHFSLWCKHQEWGRRVRWPLPKGLLHPAHWWHQGVIMKCCEEHSFSFRSMGVSLRTKHRFSITLCWSWCRLRLDIREVGVLSVTMLVSQHSAGPVLSAMKEELIKKNECGEEVWEYGMEKIAYVFFSLWGKRVARKGPKRPKESLTRMKLSSA